MDSSSSNINDVKSQLQRLGLSTSTPGLQGDDRFEELCHRLEASKPRPSIKAPTLTSDLSSSSSNTSDFVVPSLSSLSIGEIRSRLTALGENTNTPGVMGEERRNVLMQRLIAAVCVGDDDGALNTITSSVIQARLNIFF